MDLHYVILTEHNVIPVVYIPEHNGIIYHKFHNDYNFQVKNMSIHHIFDQLKIGTYADDWIKIFCEKSNGQDEWISLCGNYDGPAEGNKRVAVACSYTSNPFIKNESNFLFKKDSKILKKFFNTTKLYTQDKIHREELEFFSTILLPTMHNWFPPLHPYKNLRGQLYTVSDLSIHPSGSDISNITTIFDHSIPCPKGQKCHN